MIKDSVLQAAARFGLFEEHKRITAAVSGGADSMALLYILLELRESLGITVSAAHLNHMIRGEEAARDENFVRAECEKLGVPFVCEHIDVPKYAAENKLSLELAAREVRYDFFRRVSYGAVATAHTASDSLETMLFNLARGTALKGLCGIPPKRDIFIRPLILCSRREIEEYCAENDIRFVTDSTNLSDDYTRNKIRHNIVPLLREINPAAELAAVRTAVSLSDDEACLSAAADKYIEENLLDGRLSVSGFAFLPRAVAVRAVKKYFADLLLDNSHINDIYSICLREGRTSLPKKLSAVCRNGLLYAEKADKSFSGKQFTVETHEAVNDLFTNRRKINNLLLNNLLDCDKIMGKSVIRTRQAGDSIRLRGKGCTKTLKKLYNEYKIPQEDRESLPVIADEGGVIWVYGIGAADRCAVTEKTERILIIKASEVQNKTY